MPERIGQAPHQPTPLTRALTALADSLDQHATRTTWLGTTEQACMTTGWLDTLTPTAIGAQLPQVPYRERPGFGAVVRRALPPVAGTVAEYAHQVRALAVQA